jgi:uncharacterized membrane protein
MGNDGKERSMTDTGPQPTGQGQANGWLEPGKTNLQIIYILYLVSFVISGIPALIGVVMAYINRNKSASWLDTHYTWLIRTFWIGLLYSLISAVLLFVFIGVILMIAVAVWVIIRCIIGLQALGRGGPIRNPQSWIL